MGMTIQTLLVFRQHLCTSCHALFMPSSLILPCHVRACARLCRAHGLSSTDSSVRGASVEMLGITVATLVKVHVCAGSQPGSGCCSFRVVVVIRCRHDDIMTYRGIVFAIAIGLRMYDGGGGGCGGGALVQLCKAADEESDSVKQQLQAILGKPAATS